MNEDPFKEYIKEKTPNSYYREYAWHTAIGLQSVDGLRPSAYLIQAASRNINGEISFEEIHRLLHEYYEKSGERSAESRTEEADIVSARIAELLSEQAFVFFLQPNTYQYTRGCF